MRSIRRPERHEDLVRRLAEEPHPKSKRALFPTMRDLLCFAAVVGYEEGVRTPLGSGATKEIDGRIFENSPPAVDLIYLLALADTKNADILQDSREDEMVRIFEEYAATGLGVIESWTKETPNDSDGDQAILQAMRKGGYLGVGGQPVTKLLDEVQF